MDRPPLRRVLLSAVATAAVAATLSVPAPTRPVQLTKASVAAPATAPAARPGELLVQSRRRAVGLERAVARVAGHAVEALGGGLSLVRVPPGQEVAAAARLAADPSIAYAEPNYVRTATSHAADEVGWGVRETGAPQMWHGTTPVTGAGVRVAVLDSGVDATHPQLRGRVTKRFDAFGGSGTDDCGHGTAVAGVVAAAQDGVSTVGVAPEATIVPVRVLRFDEFFGVCGGDDAAIIRGIRWAADPRNGAADVINMSLSGPQRSRALRDAVAYAVSEGVLVVAASGNSGDRTVHYPAAYPGVVSVGGTQWSGGDVRFWPHTSFGSVDVAAAARGVRVLIAAELRDEPWRVGRSCADSAGVCADGTSFAAPHVAGVAALLRSAHPELEAMSAGQRVRRLRQWILATAPRVSGRPDGVDLQTGHGQASAVLAHDASTDPSRVLLAWDTGGRILTPTAAMATAPVRLPMRLVATSGDGTPLSGQQVAFTPPPGASVSNATQATNGGGAASTTLRSNVSGRVVALTASLGQHHLPIDTYVLHDDDNVPGVRPAATSFSGSLDRALDFDDVYRFRLRASETLRARVTNVRRDREQVLLYLHRGSTKDATNPYRAPLEEDEGFGDPRRLSKTVSSDGVRYLDVFGFGTYRLRWRILATGAVRAAGAWPTEFTPNGDGRRDTTKLSWRVARRGQVTLRIRNGGGDVVRQVQFGSLGTGPHAYRWDGRSGGGRLVRGGVYRMSLRWTDGRGRIWRTGTKVAVRR